MEAIALIPQVDTDAAARMITLGTTAIVSPSVNVKKFNLVMCLGIIMATYFKII